MQARKRIVAIIPARAGSKGIPNKNIRSINGHPLIFYSIKNAIDSAFVTEVIISTDSDEIAAVAKQMNVKCHWRNAELCSDDITLDEVVFDAMPKDISWDYIVTMQPTSPTLKRSTLDAAIEFAIKNGSDTVISAINDPHLSWIEKDGMVFPNYIERRNRQYMPAEYRETGAFIISKGNCVTKKSRIGKKVNIFELSEEEAIDVDTFVDLQSVSAILTRKKVAIYVNGNRERGTGHVYRALEIADEFYSRPDIYYDINQTDVSVFGDTTHSLKPVNGLAELFSVLKGKEYDVFINDILTTTIDYMIGLRSVLNENAFIVNFEDDGEGALRADLVFNALNEGKSGKNIYSGEDYYIAPRLFLLYKPININIDVKKIFISFGGADPQNYTDNLLDIISQDKYRDYNFIVVLGRSKENVEELMEYNKFDNIKVFYDVKNMPELMSSCDIGITSRGRTAYELAIIGEPCVVFAENEREEKHDFVSRENGFYYIGNNPSKYLIESTLDLFLKMPQEDRKMTQDTLLSNDLRHGRNKVINLINSL